MKVITVTNRKGGTGKTAVSSAMGAWLRKRNFKVLYVDLDSQANLTYSIGATEDGEACIDVLKGDRDIKDVIQKTEQGDIVPGGISLSAASIEIEADNREYSLKNALDPVKRTYQYVIVDTPAQLELTTVMALVAANSIVVPTQADIYSIKGLSLIYDVVTDVRKKYNDKLKVDGIILTRYNGRTILSQDMRGNIESIAEQLETRLIEPPIREATSVKEAAAMRQNIFSYAPSSNAAKDYDMAFTNLFGNINRQYF